MANGIAVGHVRSSRVRRSSGWLHASIRIASEGDACTLQGNSVFVDGANWTNFLRRK
jgi:hypothetical protein